MNNTCVNWMQWLILKILALESLKQKDCPDFEARLDYRASKILSQKQTRALKMTMT